MFVTVDNNDLKRLLVEKSESFWNALRDSTLQVQSFEDLQFLSTLRRKASNEKFEPSFQQRSLKLGIIGGYTFYPLTMLLEQFLFAQQYRANIWTGEYDNYVSEILDENSDLYQFHPDVVLVVPPKCRYAYSGELRDNKEPVLQEIAHRRTEILNLCEQVHSRSGAQVLLTNFLLPCHFDPGPFRVRTMASEWNYFKMLNMEIGLNAPDYVHVCDIEFLAARLGGLQARDDRGWLESKQPFSAEFACHAAKEIAQQISSLHKPSKKVLVLDLDETLWGGVIAEDGLNGIELGDTSARGQCYKVFQRAIRDLAKRGVLLAVCSKNDMQNAIAPFEQHPEMVLRLEDIASFSANWNPKSDNIIQMAKDLNLSLDSFVFIDDNPAEIEIVRQFAPDVYSIWLGKDPAQYLQLLQDSRLFETYLITEEDAQRVEFYRTEQQRKDLMLTTTDMETYLASLEMVATISPFRDIDVPRITQLINKSNQFNLTTKRRTEADVLNLSVSEAICWSVRLNDRFGDSGLISVIVAMPQADSSLLIDSWLMSCRVLKRQVEHAIMNELVSEAQKRGLRSIRGSFVPSGKNELVRDFYAHMGFNLMGKTGEQTEWELSVADFQPFTTKVSVRRNDY